MTAWQARARRGVLREPSQFEAVLRNGARVSTRNFVGRVMPNDAEEPRLGMIAGKKAAARAVDRNRAKRLIRETFRWAAPGFGACDITVQLRTDLRAIDNTVVRTELEKLFAALARRCGAPDPAALDTAAPRLSTDK